MKGTDRFLAVVGLVSFLLIPLTLHAGEVPSEAEIRQAGGMPTLIPHAVSDADGAEQCLTCHQSGKGGAPVVSHPERKNCGQCHVPAEVKKERKKGKKRG